jgi:hypothetical protein
MFNIRRFSLLVLLLPAWVRVGFAQSGPAHDAPPPAISETHVTCDAAPREDILGVLCSPPIFPEEDDAQLAEVFLAKISLHLPTGTALRIALDQRTRVDHPGESVHGKIVDSVYAFDQPVIPAGSIVSGRVTGIAPVSGVKRALAYANGNFSPFHQYEVTFEMLTLPDGKIFPIKTTVSPGTAEVVHLVSNPDKAKQKSVAGRASDSAKQEAKGKIQEAKDQAHETWNEVTGPGRMDRIKRFLLTQSPYRHQYMELGTRFVADLDAPLDFGETMRTGEELAAVGGALQPDSTLKARLAAEVSSETATYGTVVTAILTEPLYSPTHQLLLPRIAA